IKGLTLDRVLRDRPDRATERGRLLAVFAAVCQAVGFAHAHRVIHRDLKPANVMVGAFGEVQVMDWGLAKVLPGPDAQTTPRAPHRPSPKSAPGPRRTARSPGRARCWAHRRTCRPNRRLAPSTRSMNAPTCSAWARSCVPS